MSSKNAATGLKITIPLLIALISFFFLANVFSSNAYMGKYLNRLDENRDSVLKLTASSTSVSVAITALPGDIATPIAEKMADLSIGFMIVLCAIYLEKCIVAISGLVVFKFIVPIACIIWVLGTFMKRESLKSISYKLIVMALAIMLIIPASIGVSNKIQEVFGDTINETIESAEASSSLMQESLTDGKVDENTANGLGKVVESLKQSGDSIARGTTEYMKYLERLLTRYIEAVAIMVVTSCIIPILVILAIVWFLKIVFFPNFEAMSLMRK